MDLVRRTLEEARGAARSQGKDVGRGRPLPRAAPRRRRRAAGDAGRDRGRTAAIRNRSGGGHAIWRRTAAGHRRVAEGTVFGQWSTVVGEQIAEHAEPTALRDGVLSVAAESTAWATQLRMVQAQLLAKIAAAVGDGVVTALKITGPAAPSWRKGQLHISGRGPRDTYG